MSYDRYVKLSQRYKKLEELNFAVIHLFQVIKTKPSPSVYAGALNKLADIIEEIDKLPGPHESMRAPDKNN